MEASVFSNEENSVQDGVNGDNCTTLHILEEIWTLV